MRRIGLNILFEQNVEFIHFKVCGTLSNHCVVMGERCMIP